MKKIIVSIAVVIACSYGSLSYASQQVNLEQVNKKIHALQAQLEKTRNKQKALTKALKESDLSIHQISQQLQTTEQALATHQGELTRLNQHIKQQEKDIHQQQHMLSQQLASAYQLGQYSEIKMLLNQENPDDVSRLLTYYGYINLARSQLIDALNENLLSILSNRRQVEQHAKRLEELQVDQHKQHQAFIDQQAYRRAVLVELDQQINDQRQHLTTLEAEKAGLEKLLKKLDRQQPIPQPDKPFAAMRQQLPWPVAGTVSKEYAKRVKGSALEYHGVFIEAEENQAISAVYPGKVVFADWLKGFGLLTIIDHGDGYMTLYAHNNSLFKRKGDQVLAGEIIANVGNSGGMMKNGLYFEIRHRGNPVDPQLWCKA